MNRTQQFGRLPVRSIDPGYQIIAIGESRAKVPGIDLVCLVS
jgi:hypothetical protein